MKASSQLLLIEEFLELVVGTEGLVEIRTSLSNGGRFFDSHAEAAQYAQDLANDPRQARIWYGVAPRVPGTTRGRASDCYTPRVFFADLDNFPAWNQELVDRLLEDARLPPPSIVVASGGGHHLYWLHDGDISKSSWAAYEYRIVSALHRIADRKSVALDVDRGCRDVARVLQLPWVPNFKYGEDCLARVLEDVGSGEVYSPSVFAPEPDYLHDESAGRPEWWDFELPAFTRNGERDQHIVWLACRRAVRDGAPYNETLREACAHFTNPETCETPVHAAEVGEKIQRQYAYNAANREARERDDPTPTQRQREEEELDLIEIANLVVERMGESCYNVEQMRIQVHDEGLDQFMGGVFAESAVRQALGRVAEQRPESGRQLRSYQTGSQFTSLFKEVQRRLPYRKLCDMSSEFGIIPLSGRQVLNLTMGEIQSRREDPPLFNWKSPADPQRLAESISSRAYGAWSEFIESSIPDEQERLYLQRLAYYLALGGNPERVFILAYGPSSAGKNLFFESLSRAIHDRVMACGSDLVCRSTNRFDVTVQLHLSGARLAFCDEINRGDHLDPAKVKSLTSDAGIIARGAYQEGASSSSNSFVLALLSNALPELSEPDEALMNRLHFVSFRVGRRHADRSWRENDDRPAMDMTLKSRIQPHEVLAWVANGRDGYAVEGITPPESFMEDARSWFRKVDSVGTWASDMLEEDPSMSARKTFGQLHKDFVRDMHSPMTLVQFKDRLRDWTDRQGWRVMEARVDNSEGIKGIVYKGSEVV